MKQKIIKVDKYVKLPFSVEEEFQFNNQMFQISDIRDNYYNSGKNIVEEVKQEDETETTIEYEVFDFTSENILISSQDFEEKQQIRVKFSETNTLQNLKIKLNDTLYDLRNMQNKEEFVVGSIPVNVFIILEYQSEVIEETITNIVDKDDGNGGTIPTEETEVIEKTNYFFKVRYVENLNCNLLENNYNMYYNAIISSIKNFEKKYSRNVFDTDYKFYIDDISSGNIILPILDVRNIEKVCYLSTEENEDENGEIKTEIVEKEIDPSYFTVLKVGDYNEQRLIQVSETFETPKDILNDGSDESEMPYIFYFSVGFENNIFPEDLKLAFMNDVQFKLMNRGSELLTVSSNRTDERTMATTDFCKNVFKNYKYMNI